VYALNNQGDGNNPIQFLHAKVDHLVAEHPITRPPYRLLMLDIDGTLLNEQGEITPRTRRAVQAAVAAGVLVTLATARRYASAALFAADLALNAPLATYDGALIREYPSGEIWHIDPLPASLGQAAVDAIARHGLQPVVQQMLPDGERMLSGPASADTPWVATYFSVFSGQLERRPHAELCAGDIDPLRVVAFGPEERLEPIAAELRPLPCELYLNPQGSYNSAELSIMSPTVSKGNALSVLSSRLQLSISETMAIGDSFNDLSMLSQAGMGIAMGQAPPEVRAAARALTLSNSTDGVAIAIERYLLNSDK
jgi:Cof subfamily protein (haloacid dehalogenase superfamily)